MFNINCATVSFNNLNFNGGSMGRFIYANNAQIDITDSNIENGTTENIQNVSAEDSYAGGAINIRNTTLNLTNTNFDNNKTKSSVTSANNHPSGGAILAKRSTVNVV